MKGLPVKSYFQYLLILESTVMNQKIYLKKKLFFELKNNGTVHCRLITPAKWSRTVLECSKIILEFSRTMF